MSKLRNQVGPRSIQCLLVALAIAGDIPARAAIPEPNAVVHGDVIVDGFPLGNGGTVQARVGSTVIANYVIGSNLGIGRIYALKLPLESLADGGTSTPGVLRVGNSVSLFANGINSGFSYVIAERAAVAQINLSGIVTTNPDIDSDGVSNWLDNCGGSSNPSQADANQNGIGDPCEAIQNPLPTYLSIGNPGNAADPVTGLGAVAHAFTIENTEVTNVQYRDFLQAVATSSDVHGLFNANMATDPRGGITRIGASPPYSYKVRPNMGDKPVNFVSWLDSARYSNWLQNGSPSNAPSSTEQGAFDLLVADPRFNATKSPTATAGLLSLNEWYKAAYYDPFTASYSDFPTRTSGLPNPTPAISSSLGVVTNPGANVVNYANGASWAAQTGNVTNAAGTFSASAYQTYDQGGNVAEWLAEPAVGQLRMIRGGSYANAFELLRADAATINPGSVRLDPLYEGADVGIRVPEPGLATSLAAGVLFLISGVARSSRRRDVGAIE